MPLNRGENMELKELKTKKLGRNLMCFEVLESTQKKAKTLKKPIDGTLIISENQTDGVGTHDRKWYTGNGQNSAMSFVLMPECNIKKIQNITIILAKCLAEVLGEFCDVQAEIKEPNDLYYNGKKVAGILTETVCKGEIVKKIYVGIGLNVNQESFPGNLGEIATSLKIEFGKEFDREKIIVEFLNEFEGEYDKLTK